jgi:hypothetical protein
MINLTRKLTFRRCLWIPLTIAIFVLEGFIDLGTGQGNGFQYWGMLRQFSGIGSHETVIWSMVFMADLTLVLALSAAIFALIVQYLVGMVWESFTQRRDTEPLQRN